MENAEPASFPRRRWFGAALAVAALGPELALASLRKMTGRVYVNNRPSAEGYEVGVGDRIIPSHDSGVTVVREKDAFGLSAVSDLRLDADHRLILYTGELTGVFSSGMRVITPHATVDVDARSAVRFSVSPSATILAIVWGGSRIYTHGAGHAISIDHGVRERAHRITREAGGAIVAARYAGPSAQELKSLSDLIAGQ